MLQYIVYFSYYRCWINGSPWIYKGPILVILVVCESLLTLKRAHRPKLVCSIGFPFPITSPSLMPVTLKPLFIDWKDASRMLSVHFLINSFFWQANMLLFTILLRVIFGKIATKYSNDHLKITK